MSGDRLLADSVILIDHFNGVGHATSYLRDNRACKAQSSYRLDLLVEESVIVEVTRSHSMCCVAGLVLATVPGEPTVMAGRRLEQPLAGCFSLLDEDQQIDVLGGPWPFIEDRRIVDVQRHYGPAKEERTLGQPRQLLIHRSDIKRFDVPVDWLVHVALRRPGCSRRALEAACLNRGSPTLMPSMAAIAK